MSEVNELEQIRARHEACGHVDQWPDYDSFMAHTDRATLLRLLDAAREELDALTLEREEAREVFVSVLADLGRVKDAAFPFVQFPPSGLLRDNETLQMPVTVGQIRRLAAALKAPPTRAQGESS